MQMDEWMVNEWVNISELKDGWTTEWMDEYKTKFVTDFLEFMSKHFNSALQFFFSTHYIL